MHLGKATCSNAGELAQYLLQLYFKIVTECQKKHSSYPTINQETLCITFGVLILLYMNTEYDSSVRRHFILLCHRVTSWLSLHRAHILVGPFELNKGVIGQITLMTNTSEQVSIESRHKEATCKRHLLPSRERVCLRTFLFLYCVHTGM